MCIRQSVAPTLNPSEADADDAIASCPEQTIGDIKDIRGNVRASAEA